MTEPIQLRPLERGRGDVCLSCGQPLPSLQQYLTDRELDVLTAWWLTDSVKDAATMAGVAEQRAKNLLSAARIRNGASSNAQLVTMYLFQMRHAVLRFTEHNSRGQEAR
jgi:hypothetical protein